MHFEPNRRAIRRTSSESDVIQREIKAVAGAKESFKRGSTPFPARIPEEEEFLLTGIASFSFSDDRKIWQENEIWMEDVGFPGGGMGNNRKFTGGGRDEQGANSSSGDQSKTGAYYQEMIKSNPTNSLLLRNYAMYLHEVHIEFIIILYYIISPPIRNTNFEVWI